MKHAITSAHCAKRLHQRFWQTRTACALLGLMPALCGHIALAQDKSAANDSPLPAMAAAPVPPEGLASLYPGDEGLERDPRVLFVEDFETGGLDKIGARWGDRRVAAARMELVPDRPPPRPASALCSSASAARTRCSPNVAAATSIRTRAPSIRCRSGTSGTKWNSAGVKLGRDGTGAG